MKSNRMMAIVGLALMILAFSGWLCTPLHAQDTPDQENSTAKKNGGLGGFFADSLKQMIQSGTVFVPNGASAKPVESATPGEPKKFKLNFNNAPIDQVLKFLSDMTKKLVLKTPTVQGQFTIMNPNEVTKDQAMHIIDTAFRFQDITFEETDQMIIVLPLSVAKQKLGSVSSATGEFDQTSRFQNKIIQLHYASPTQIKEALTPLLSENSNIIADERTKTIVLTDTKANIDRFELIIKQLDKQTTKEGVAIRVFQLRYLDARELSRSLDDMLQSIVMAKLSSGSVRERRDLAKDISEVLADRATNSLIIAAPEYAIETIAQFIEKLDSSSIQNMTTKTVALKNSDASEVSQGLQQFMMARRTNYYRPIVFADSRSNSIVIHAYPEDVDAVMNVLAELDKKQSYDRVTRVYMLENADAIVISEMVKQLVTDQSNNSRNNRSYYYFYGSRGRGQDENEIKIVEDQRLNALIVTAKPADIPMVEELIEALDQPIPESKEEPRVYPIKNVRATDLSYMLEEIFSSETTGSYGSFFGFQNQQQSITGLSGKIKTIADPTTNSLIVLTSTPRAFGIIENLIQQLDRIAPEFGTTKVYPLKNAEAGYLATQLTALFEENRNQQGNRGFFWYLNQQSTGEEDISNLIGNVRIVSETRTNSLLVTTSSQYFDSIDHLIEDLDREISQILVEIMIVEIIDVKDDQFGINWGDQVKMTAEGILDAPLSGIDLDRVAILSNVRYDAVLDILASNQKTNVIARPNILTGDNQDAFVEVINRIPRLAEISQGNVTTTQNIEYEEVGLKLNVTPHINDATTTTIEVNLETGQILEQFALVTPNGSAPAFSRRTVDTRLTIKNEETAVLSGVIDTNFTETEDGVPLLKDIPILGYIFKSHGNKQTKTELMTFITPYILADQQDRIRILERQSQRINKYKKFKQMMKDVDVRVGVR